MPSRKQQQGQTTRRKSKTKEEEKEAEKAQGKDGAGVGDSGLEMEESPKGRGEGKPGAQGPAACAGRGALSGARDTFRETVGAGFGQRGADFLLLHSSVPGAPGWSHLPGVGKVSISSLFMSFAPRVG